MKRGPQPSCTAYLSGAIFVLACSGACSSPGEDPAQSKQPDGGSTGGGSGGSNGGGSGGFGGAGIGGSTEGSGGSSGTSNPESKTALEQLKAWLALERESRPALDTQGFAKTALTESDAAQARTLLWDDFAGHVGATRGAEVGADGQTEKSITIGNVTLRYYKAVRGQKPATGWNLFISMHGGGGTAASVNDEQWRNQLALVSGYNPQNAIWVAPRAPTDEWNMWFREHMDGLFERLVTNFIVFEEVDPNHVYLTGYSAGGDGAYQLGPRMADCWAGVGMSAGHPNDASPLSMRNTAFALHVGALDTAFNRNVLVETWGKELEALAAADPGGYPNQWQVHEGYAHWMELTDAVSIPFLQQHARNPIANKIVWRQASVLRQRFYWLAVDEAAARAGSEVTASYSDNTIELRGVKELTKLTIRLSDAMVDLDQPVQIRKDGTALFSDVVPRTIAALHRTLVERGDPEMVFSAEVALDLN